MLESINTKIHNLAEQLGARQGWQRFWVAFLLGLLNAFAFPPFNIVPILWICFPCLIFLLRGTTSIAQAFGVGWSFAFGFFLAGLYWIACALLVDLAHLWWALPFAIVGLPIVFSFYYGCAAAAAWRFGLKDSAGVITFALMWFLADYARGHMFTGFPWILTGHAWSSSTSMLQIVSVIGVYGLTLVTLLCACLGALLAHEEAGHRRAFWISLMFLVSFFLWGEARLLRADASYANSTPNTRLRLVQPNIDQTTKWDLQQRANHFQLLLDLSSAPSSRPLTHIIWPETAATYYLMEDAEHRNRMAQILPKEASLITGVIRREPDTSNQLQYFNSLIAINAKAQVLATYDKFHLVPFGEYVPFRSWLPLRALASMGLDFSTGEGVRSLRVAGLPSFSPLICYEAIFPGDVADPLDRPHFLLNITNDGWYGHSSGPYQHFALVKFRALEEGLPLVRVANTGISGVIDAYGRTPSVLGLGERGFLDVDLPQALPPTVFSHYKDSLLWILFAGCVCGVLISRHRKRRRA